MSKYINTVVCGSYPLVFHTMMMYLSRKFVLSLVYAGLFKSCVGDVCEDKLPDCADYTLDSCKSPYTSWAFQNCKAFCGFCQKQCVNNRGDCQEYGKSMCQPPYEKWAKQNCAEYCGYCGSDAKCLYSPWVKLTPCSPTCQTVEVRSVTAVPSSTPLSRNCTGNLIRRKSCNIKQCTTTTTSTTTTIKTTPKPVHEVVHVPVHETVHVRPDPVDVVTGVGTAVGLGAAGLMLSELFAPLAVFSLLGKRSSGDNVNEILDLMRNIEEAKNIPEKRSL